MKRNLAMLLIFAVPLLVNATDEIKKESAVKIQSGAKIETDTYFQGRDRVLEIERIISLRSDDHMTRQKILWNDSVVVEYDISHFSVKPGHYIYFHSVPGVNAVTAAKPDGTMTDISLVSTNLTLLRSFVVVDGLLSPVPMDEVKRTNAFMGEVEELFDDFKSGETSGDEFVERIKVMTKKNQKNDGTTMKSTLSPEAAPSASPDER